MPKVFLMDRLNNFTLSLSVINKILIIIHINESSKIFLFSTSDFSILQYNNVMLLSETI